jgi:hypothetical protein
LANDVQNDLRLQLFDLQPQLLSLVKLTGIFCLDQRAAELQDNSAVSQLVNDFRHNLLAQLQSRLSRVRGSRSRAGECESRLDRAPTSRAL